MWFDFDRWDTIKDVTMLALSLTLKEMHSINDTFITTAGVVCSTSIMDVS